MVHGDHGIGQFVALRKVGPTGDGAGGLPPILQAFQGLAGAAPEAAAEAEVMEIAYAAGKRLLGAAVAARRGREVQRHRRGGAAPRQPRRHLLEPHQEPGAEEPARHGRRAAQALRRPPDRRGAGDAPGQRLRAPDRRRLRLRRDPRPARGDRRHHRRPRTPPADGPPAVRRRRLRQDRGGDARRLQGGRRRLPGGGAGAHHHPRRPAPGDLPEAFRRLPGVDRDDLPLPLGRGDPRGEEEAGRRPGRRPGRHPSPVVARRRDPQAGPAHRRRGAALRRGAEGEAQAAQEGRPRPRHVGDAGAADPPTVARRGARPVGHRDSAQGPHGGGDRDPPLRPPVRARGHRLRDRARRPGLLRLQPGGDDRADAHPAARDRPRGAGDGGARPARRGGAGAPDAFVHPRRVRRPAWPPPSSRTASTSPTSTP